MVGDPVVGARGRVVLADNLDVMRSLPDACLDLVYVDPPFNTRKRQVHRRLRTIRDPDGDRIGFQGRRYRSIPLGASSYLDVHDDYLDFLEPRLSEVRRLLKPSGSLYVHLDYREVHYVKVLLDSLFGRASFLNEIIWAYDFGARTRRRWPPKHDSILLYAKDARRYYFDASAIERIPYLAPGLVGPEKAARGKLPTDVFWLTIVPTCGRERTGYPTQKPLALLRRLIRASAPVDGLVADFFAGSGTTGVACFELGRRFLLVDDNPAAYSVMARRLGHQPGVELVEPPRLIGGDVAG